MVSPAEDTAMQVSEHYQGNSCTTSNSAIVSLHSSYCAGLESGKLEELILAWFWKGHWISACLKPKDFAMSSLTNTIAHSWPLVEFC